MEATPFIRQQAAMVVAEVVTVATAVQVALVA